MVTEKAPALSEEQRIQELAKTMEFDDRTQPDLVAEKPAEPVVSETQTPPPPAESAPAPTPQVKTETPKTEPPKVNIYETPEWREAQSKNDQRVAAIERRLRETEARAQAEAARIAVEAATEAHLKAQEEQWARQLGDPEAARTHVRSTQNAQAVRGFYETQEQLKQERQIRTQQEQTLEYAGRVYAADEFSRMYNVAPEDHKVLLTASTPAAMQLLAQRLGRVAADKEQAKTRVPAENARTRLETGEQGAAPSGNFWDLLTSAQDKHWSEMSPAERKASEQAYKGNYPAR